MHIHHCLVPSMSLISGAHFLLWSPSYAAGLHSLRCLGPRRDQPKSSKYLGLWVGSIDVKKNTSPLHISKQEQELKLVHGLGKAAVGLLIGLGLLLSGGEQGLACSNTLTGGEAVLTEDRGDEAENSAIVNSTELGYAHDFKGILASKGHRSIRQVKYRLRLTVNGAPSHSQSGLVASRKGLVREAMGESSAMTYGQILQGRDDTTQRKAMFTDDAWLGMTKLQQYHDLLDQIEAKEKSCLECTKNRRLLEQVWQTVSNEYYDQYGSFSQAAWSEELYNSLMKTGGLLRSKLETYNTIKEMVETLGDRYSVFLGPQQYRLAIHRPIPSEIKYLTYQYTGVGVELGKKSPSGGLTIMAPFAGSPAEEAGLLAGERLRRIDGRPVDSLSAEQAVSLLRGPEGSMVELEVTGVQAGSPVRTLVLERRALPLPPLRTRMLNAGNGRVLSYMRLHYFTHEGTKNMAAAIREGEALGVDGYSEFVLDLRNNPGGVFEEAVAMAALWLDCKGCDVTETVRSSVSDIEDLVYSVNKLPKEIFLKHPGMLTHAPLVIITNRSSASASEVLTGALHDNHRATTVGEKTYGKGVVQYFFPMDDGSGLKLTVAKYLTPSRFDISKQGGLEPDRVCSDFPRGSADSDRCIEEAVVILAAMDEGNHGETESPPLPYRWQPLSERKLWAGGSY